MREDESDWLVAGNGIHRGQPGGEWTLLGAYRYTVNQIWCGREICSSPGVATGSEKYRPTGRSRGFNNTTRR